MKRYKIMVYTIQGQQLFFCHWKMGNNYHTRMVTNRGDSIWYTDSDIDYVEHYLKSNIDRLEVKTYSITEASHRPDKTSKRLLYEKMLYLQGEKTINSIQD
jgi:hypothetical protein